MVDGLINHLSEYKDDELRKIIYTNYREYEEEIVQAAKNELYSRYDTNFWEADNLKLWQLATYCDFFEVSERLLEFYPNEEMRISKYEYVFEKLKVNQEIESQEIQLSVQKVNKPLNKDYWNVHGIDIKTHEIVDLKYCKWSEWALFLVNKKQLKDLGKEAYIAHCLREMTAEGFDEEEIQEKFMEVREANGSFNIPIGINTENKNVDMDNFISEGIKRRKEFKYNYDGEEVEQYNVRPWIRFFARGIDLYIWFSIIDLVWKYLSYSSFRLLNSYIWSSLFIYSIQYIVWIFIEAILLSKYGFTIGKWVLNVYVRDTSGNKPGYYTALKRAAYVFLYGEGLYIPPVLFVTNIVSYLRLTGTGKTKWDELLNISVSHTKIQKYKVLIAILILVIVPIIRLLS